MAHPGIQMTGKRARRTFSVPVSAVLSEAGGLSQSSCGTLRPGTAPGSDGVEGICQHLSDSQISTLL